MKRLIILLLIINICGCSRVDQQKEIAGVLAEDPGFSAVLERKKYLDRELKKIKEECVQKHKLINTQISALQKKKSTCDRYLSMRIKQLNAEITHERSKIRVELKNIAKNLAEKRQKSNSINNIIFNTQQVLKGTEKVSEKRRLEREIVHNRKILEKLKTETNELKNAAKLFKTKLRLLKR
ncbi:MAG: hypothetical protein ABH952_02775 [Candidatus Omnitrophota bacterium]